MVDANGFTLAEAAELRRRIADVEKGKITARGIIETFSKKRQKRLYNIHYTEIGKCYIKEKRLGEALKWAFKTTNPLKTICIFAKDGVVYVTRKK